MSLIKFGIIGLLCLIHSLCYADGGGGGGGSGARIVSKAQHPLRHDISDINNGGDITSVGTCLSGACTPTLSTDTDGNYVASVADGTGIDGTASGEGSTYTPTFDATELEGLTWGAGSNTSNTWTFNLSGTDPAIKWTSGLIQPLTNIDVSKVDPEIRITDTGNSEYSRVTRVDTSNQMVFYNRVSTPGAVGSAVNFTGGNGSGGPASALTGAAWTEFAIEFWMNPSNWNDGTYQLIVFNFTQYGVGKRSANDLYATINNGSWNDTVDTSGATYTNGTWYHIVVNWSQADQKLYFYRNASLLSSPTVTASPTGTNDKFRLASNNVGTQTFSGILDEVRVYNRMLTTNEITAHYASGSGQFGSAESGLVGGWHLDENTGTSAADYSGNATTVTLNGSIAWATGLVSTVSAMNEAVVINSQDGVASGEKGIHSFGDTSGKTVLQGTITSIGKRIHTPSSAQVIDAVGDTISADATIVVLNPNGDYTLTSAPTIANGTTGQVLYITCDNAEANIVTVQDQDSLASSNLQLGAASRAVSGKDVLQLVFDGTDWCEISFSNN